MLTEHCIPPENVGAHTLLSRAHNPEYINQAAQIQDAVRQPGSTGFTQLHTATNQPMQQQHSIQAARTDLTHADALEYTT